MEIVVKTETEADYEQITRVHTAAFNGDSEARLVEKLRKTPMYIPELSLVAEYREEIVGHILFYPMIIKTKAKKCITLSLAPISVITHFQNRKVGSRLIEEGLRRARKLGYGSVIVVGHSKYYPRFGFEKASKYGISASFNVPDNAFFAMELKKDALKDCKWKVEYPKEFSEFV